LVIEVGYVVSSARCARVKERNNGGKKAYIRDYKMAGKVYIRGRRSVRYIKDSISVIIEKWISVVQDAKYTFPEYKVFEN
jgi:hypothetical protein